MTVPKPNKVSPAERVLAVASRLFYQRGIRATGIDAIIAESGVAKASFYKHYSSKDDLVVAFLRRRDEQWRRWVAERVEALSPTPGGRPLAVFDVLGERFSGKDFRGCAFINCMVELADRSAPAHLAAVEHKRAVTAYFESLLREAGVANAPEVAHQFIVLMDGAIVTAVREGRPDSAMVAKGIAALILTGARG